MPVSLSRIRCRRASTSRWLAQADSRCSARLIRSRWASRKCPRKRRNRRAVRASPKGPASTTTVPDRSSRFAPSSSATMCRSWSRSTKAGSSIRSTGCAPIISCSTRVWISRADLPEAIGFGVAGEYFSRHTYFQDEARTREKVPLSAVPHLPDMGHFMMRWSLAGACWRADRSAGALRCARRKKRTSRGYGSSRVRHRQPSGAIARRAKRTFRIATVPASSPMPATASTRAWTSEPKSSGCRSRPRQALSTRRTLTRWRNFVRGGRTVSSSRAAPAWPSSATGSTRSGPGAINSKALSVVVGRRMGISRREACWL